MATLSMIVFEIGVGLVLKAEVHNVVQRPD
jgi:hypothetical protein